MAAPNGVFKRLTLVAVATWTLLLVGLLLYLHHSNHEQMLKLVKAEAEIAFDKDVLYRRWSAMHGGVYAPVTDKTPPNPLLTNIPERDITTPSGKRLTLINPAYMTRQVHEITSSALGILGHITSLKPIRPENAPDPWESKALHSFERGAGEFVSLEFIGEKKYLRFMKPLITETPCLRCHATQGYKKGEIRGGISVSIPMQDFLAADTMLLRQNLLGFGLIWVVGLFAIISGSRLLSQKTNQIRVEESKYRTIFENIQDVFYRTDLQGIFTEISPSIYKYSGYRREELLGKPAADFYAHPAERDLLLATMQKAGQVIDYEILMLAKDNRLVHASLTAHILYDAMGKPTGLEGILRDITDRKRAEELNRQYSQDLEKLLSISHEITTTTDQKSLYRSFVSESKELLALDFSSLMLLSEDKTRLTIRDCVGFPESMIGSFNLVEGQGLSTFVVKNKTPAIVSDFSSETRFEVPPVVREKHIQAALAVPMMMKDEIIGVLIGHTLERREFTPKDINVYQHVANQAAVAIRNVMNMDMLRKSEKMTRDITDALGEGLYALDDSGRLTFMNPEAERLLGWSETELKGKTIHDLVHSRRADGAYFSAEDCPVQNVIRTGERFTSKAEVYARKDGIVFPVAIITAPIIEEGKTVASITSFQDISEQKRNEQEREQLITELQTALSELKTLRGILPICSFCKKIRDTKGAWTQMESYISRHSEAQFSHGICAECMAKHYPEYVEKEDGK
ncbi:MAG: PAS domain S-box protein [Desulfobulbaceae bacterium]|nr:PAS domain S-box protein [Desulfobulbaceae bacterium]